MLVAAGQSAAAPQLDPASEARAVVRDYYAAVAAGNTGAAERFTHVDAKLFAARNDKLMQTPLTLWPRVADVKMDGTVVGAAAVNGTAASVEVRRAGTAGNLVEQVSLVRFNGAWRVMSIVQGVAGSS